MVLIGIVEIGRRGRTLWCLMLEKGSATRRICPFCMTFTIACTKQRVNCVVRLACITIHISWLMGAINSAQSDGPVACFVFDKMKDVQFHWEDTPQRKILHLRIE